MINLKLNRIIKYLLVSDFIFWSGWGLVSPILAIYVVKQIQGGSEMVVGLATAIYWILLSVLRVPLGIYLDGKGSEKLNYYYMTAGLFAASFISFGFIFATLSWHLYVLQAMHAVAMVANFTGWSALFTRHIDKGREATEWSLDATSVGIGTGVSALAGSWAAAQFGFKTVFLFVGTLGLIGSILLLAIRKELDKKSGHGIYFNFRDLIRKGGEGPV
jgi:MFS family permease